MLWRANASNPARFRTRAEDLAMGWPRACARALAAFLKNKQRARSRAEIAEKGTSGCQVAGTFLSQDRNRTRPNGQCQKETQTHNHGSARVYFHQRDQAGPAAVAPEANEDMSSCVSMRVFSSGLGSKGRPHSQFNISCLKVTRETAYQATPPELVQRLTFELAQGKKHTAFAQ